MQARILIVDDHSVVRDGLGMILGAQGDMNVIGEARNGRDAVAKCGALRPDVIVMDIAMPELNGIEATRLICESLPSVRIIILSMHHTNEHVFRALRAGALGYILKESAGFEVVKAVRAVMKGLRYLGRGVELPRNADRPEGSPSPKSPLDRLSQREREVLQLVVEGKASTEIADLLSLSPKSVDTYRSRLMLKLGVTNFPSLVKFALLHGITPP